jgi:excisionase family DNA binding protein
MLTTAEVAERLGVTVQRVHQFIKDERLPAEKMGRDYIINEGDLKLLEDRQTGRPPKAKTSVIATPNAIDITLKLNQSFREAKEAEEASKKKAGKKRGKK